MRKINGMRARTAHTRTHNLSFSLFSRSLSLSLLSLTHTLSISHTYAHTRTHRSHMAKMEAHHRRRKSLDKYLEDREIWKQAGKCSLSLHAHSHTLSHTFFSHNYKYTEKARLEEEDRRIAEFAEQQRQRELAAQSRRKDKQAEKNVFYEKVGLTHKSKTHSCTLAHILDHSSSLSLSLYNSWQRRCKRSKENRRSMRISSWSWQWLSRMRSTDRRRK